MVEQSNREIANKIGNKERPIILRHGCRGEINIVYDVDPHVARVVSQVLPELNRWVCQQSRPVGGIKSRCDGHLAFDTDFIKVTPACVIRQSSLLLIAFSLKAFKKVGAQTGSVA